MTNDVLKGYEAAASRDFIERLDAISSATLLAPVIEHLPQRPSQILDIGAGTGRDAAWFASRSHSVVAVEPVDALRHAGIERHRSSDITWLKDTLPRLSQTLSFGKTFDFILLSAVWQHLCDDDRQTALAALRRLVSGEGKVVMSIRHGAGSPSRPVFPANISNTVKWAEQQGFLKLSEVSAGSVQAGNQKAGVRWTWLVLKPSG